jgi:hypothetical protein
MGTSTRWKADVTHVVLLALRVVPLSAGWSIASRKTTWFAMRSRAAEPDSSRVPSTRSGTPCTRRCITLSALRFGSSAPNRMNELRGRFRG